MFRSIPDAAAALRSGQISCLELVEESLKRIAERDGELNAFITVTSDPAREEARLLDAELSAGRDRGPLHGIPIAYKDLFFTKGVLTTNGSKLFADFVPDYDAAVVEKLRAAGAISMGKLNMHELAYGVTSTNPHHGAVRNPHALDHVPGGSSGGSGAAVASGMVFMAMGSDTGGSIRIPASYCGTVGLKATFGLVSRFGAFPLGLTLDHMGPLTRTVEDAAITLEAITGYDSRDNSTVRRAVPAFRPNHGSSLKGVMIGVPRNFFTESVSAPVLDMFRRYCEESERAGARLVDVTVPDVAALNVIARTVLFGEAAAVLGPHLHRRDEIGEDVMALLDQGRLQPATDYINAQRIRFAMQQEWSALFRGFDVLITPATPITAPKIGQRTVDIDGKTEDTRLATTRFLRGINVLGLPAISLPAGTDGAGLPLGLQLVGKPYDEARLLQIAAALERVH